MRNIAITIFIALIVITMGLYLISFQVRETESCLVTTFGKPSRQYTEPGWHFRWPFPIQQIHKFDSRMRVFSTEVEETRTDDGEPIIVNTYVVWRIVEPEDFLKALETVDVLNAEEELLRNRIRNTQNTVIGNHYFSEFVNSDPNRIQFKTIEDEMLADLQQAVSDANYGVEVVAMGIKQLKVSEEVSKAVFARMSSDRERRATRIISEGTATKERIETDADQIKQELETAADARAKIIRGQGDAKAAEFYEKLETNSQLAIFLRELEVLPTMLGEKSTYVVPTDLAPFSLLKGVPEILLSPVEPNDL